MANIPMANIPLAERCEADSWSRGYMHRCFHRAALNEEGKQYCRVHAPSRVAERKAKQEAVWHERAALREQGRAEGARRQAEAARKLAAYDGLVAVLEAAERIAALATGLSDEILAAGLQIANLGPQLRAALAAARKGQNV